MRATVMYGAGNVRIENVPDPRLAEPTDALVAVNRAAICGSDLWPYKTMEHSDTGRRMGPKLSAVAGAAATAAQPLKPGNGAASPFLGPSGPCVSGQRGRQTECLLGGGYGLADVPPGR